MCSASYGTRSPRATAIRSSSASRLSSESTSWNTSATRRYDSTSASGRPVTSPTRAAWLRPSERAEAACRTMDGSSADAEPILTPVRLHEPADTRRVRPRPEAATRAVGAGRRLELSPGRPVVGGSPASGEVVSVAPLERDIHLQAAEVAVAGVRVPGALVTVDAEECTAKRDGERRMGVAMPGDRQRSVRATELPEPECPRSAREVGARESPRHAPGIDAPQAQSEPAAVGKPRGKRAPEPRPRREHHGKPTVDPHERPPAHGELTPRPAVGDPFEIVAIGASPVPERRRRPREVRGALVCPGQLSVVVDDYPKRANRRRPPHGSSAAARERRAGQCKGE